MKLFGKIIFVAVFLTLSFSSVVAQETKKTEDPEAARAASMKKLDFLIGDWEGKGWIIIGRERKEFTVKESLWKKFDGRIVIVEGVGKSKDEKTGAEKIIHNAYGIFSFDEASGELRFRWYKENGQSGDAVPEFSDKKFVWGFDVPENKITVRFSENINEKGNWYQIGEVTRDGGANWFKFFEMELSKIK